MNQFKQSWLKLCEHAINATWIKILFKNLKKKYAIFFPPYTSFFLVAFSYAQIISNHYYSNWLICIKLLHHFSEILMWHFFFGNCFFFSSFFTTLSHYISSYISLHGVVWISQWAMAHWLFLFQALRSLGAWFW